MNEPFDCQKIFSKRIRLAIKVEKYTETEYKMTLTFVVLLNESPIDRTQMTKTLHKIVV